jgi:predicted acetyltransferase
LAWRHLNLYIVSGSRGSVAPLRARTSGRLGSYTELFRLTTRGFLTESLRYRFARTEELQEVGRLVAHSFPGPHRTPGWWYEQLRDPTYGGGAETLLVGQDGDRLVAACQVHPLRQWVAGETIATAGVGTVAIAPTHRKRRLGGELVTQAIRAARERGDVASALYPFRVSFYRKLGYGNAGEAHQFLVGPDALPDSDERARVELIDSDVERVEVLALYRRWARGETGQLDRSDRMLTQLSTATDRALFAYRAEAGGLEGYALVHYRADLPPQTRYLEVDELVWTSPAARRGLLGWLSSLGDQWQRILLRARSSDRLGEWIREPRLPWGAAPGWGLWNGAATLMMGPMFRLLDVERAWRGRSVVPTQPFAVGLRLRDEQISENAGEWTLSLADGRVEVARQLASPLEMTLDLDISALSRLFIGAISPSAASSTDLLSCDRPDRLSRLDEALRIPEPSTWDRF